MLVRGDLDNANQFRSQPAPLCRLGTDPSDFLPSAGMRRPKPARKSVLGMFGLSKPLGLESKNLIQGDKLTTHSPIVWWEFLAFTEAPVSSLSSQFCSIIRRFLFLTVTLCMGYGEHIVGYLPSLYDSLGGPLSSIPHTASTHQR